MGKAVGIPTCTSSAKRLVLIGSYQNDQMMTIKITSDATLNSEHYICDQRWIQYCRPRSLTEGVRELKSLYLTVCFRYPGAKIAKMSYSTDHVAMKCGRKEDVVSVVSHSNLFHHSISPYTVGCGELPETFSGSFVSFGQSTTINFAGKENVLPSGKY